MVDTVASMVAQAEPARAVALSINNIEVIYDHVILVLKGVSRRAGRRHRRAAGAKAERRR